MNKEEQKRNDSALQDFHFDPCRKTCKKIDLTPNRNSFQNKSYPFQIGKIEKAIQKKVLSAFPSIESVLLRVKFTSSSKRTEM
ncbi:hypothetical protein DLM75_03505 [Leptospira stimsonii]|uniref:Uncharacterized protein n=1 Tax=Leptospira stimsonii TaxID=2202203 RepID=A0A396Z9N5_9LEPT|nr:hypothetical protein DLM75_03505 [Leptospira stimsonii]